MVKEMAAAELGESKRRAVVGSTRTTTATTAHRQRRMTAAVRSPGTKFYVKGRKQRDRYCRPWRIFFSPRPCRLIASSFHSTPHIYQFYLFLTMRSHTRENVKPMVVVSLLFSLCWTPLVNTKRWCALKASESTMFV